MCNHHNFLEEIWTNSKDPVLKIVALSHSFIKIQCCKQQYCVITNNDNTCAQCASALQKLSDLSCLLVLSPETSLWILVAAPRILPPVHSSAPLIILTTHAMVCVRLLFCFIYLNKFFGQHWLNAGLKLVQELHVWLINIFLFTRPSVSISGSMRDVEVMVSYVIIVRFPGKGSRAVPSKSRECV